MAMGNFIELTKGSRLSLASLMYAGLPAVDLQMALAPGSDIDFKLVVSQGCDEFLNGSAFSHGELLVRSPVQFAFQL
jgi:hypothetical protein